MPEYEPPDGLRPAQLGLVLDERADTYDLTATIVDLAMRGFLRIEKVEGKALLARDDWRLVRLEAEPKLEPYEQELFEGVFGSSDSVLLSERKGKVAPSLKQAQRKLYEDAMGRRWFTGDPEHARLIWAGIGIGLMLAGAGLAVVLGLTLGEGLRGPRPGGGHGRDRWLVRRPGPVLGGIALERALHVLLDRVEHHRLHAGDERVERLLRGRWLLGWRRWRRRGRQLVIHPTDGGGPDT